MFDVVAEGFSAFGGHGGGALELPGGADVVVGFVAGEESVDESSDATYDDEEDESCGEDGACEGAYEADAIHG